MRTLGRGKRSRLLPVVVAALAVSAVACGSGDDDPAPQARPFAVVSAFPAELAPHLKRAVISETRTIDGRLFRIGTLDGVPVVLALTGIGLVNAEARTRSLLEHFDVRGIVVSAVAGSTTLPIGDVAVPLTWMTKDGATYAADPQWLALAREVAVEGTAALDACTTVASAKVNPVCLVQLPSIVVGGVGQSSDPFGGKAFACQMNSNPVYGCDVTPDGGAAAAVGPHATETATAADTEAPVAEDMETAAIAGEAAAHGVRFIAFRAMSDGPGDPLGLGGFPTQFFAYYPLAADNAAAATVAFLKRAAAVAP